VEKAFIKFAGEVPPGSSVQVLSNGGDTTLSMRIVRFSSADINLIFKNISVELEQSELELILEENNEESADQKEVVLLLIKKLNINENAI
jgi:hypothetical protein